MFPRLKTLVLLGLLAGLLLFISGCGNKGPLVPAPADPAAAPPTS